MTTFKEQLLIDVQETIHNELEFAKIVDWYPGGDPNRRVRLNVVSFHDDLEGSREVHGDGRVLHREEGTRLRESIIYEIQKADLFREDYAFRNPRGHGLSAQETFVEDGRVYLAKRIIGEDDETLSVLCIRSEPITTKKKQMLE